MKHLSALSCFAVVAAIFLWVSDLSARADDAAIRQLVEANNARYDAAWAAGDINTLTMFFTDDAMWRAEDGKEVQGKDAIRQKLNEIVGGTLTTNASRVEMVGDVVLDVGEYSVKLPADAGGETVGGQFLAVLTKSGEDWKIHRLFDLPKAAAGDQ